MADIAKKDINLAQEIYIHYKKENYLNYRKKYVDGMIDMN